MTEKEPRESSASPAPRKRGRPPKRQAKRAALLEGAVGLFNARGIAGVSLSDIAEAVGLSRATLYYYVDDRDELVFQCYLHACQATAEDLVRAAGETNGFSRIASFVRRTLAPGRKPAAVLSEIRYLKADLAETIAIAQRRNVTTLIGFLEAGMDDGSIRRCVPGPVAQAIFGMLYWAPLSSDWVGAVQDASFRERVAATVLDILTHGIARDRNRVFSCRIDVETFLPGRINAFDRREASEMKLEQLLAAASALFNRDGIEATSLESITAGLGTTKGALYHYVREKAELVIKCYARAFDLYERFIETAEREGRDALDAAMIDLHLNVQAQASVLSPLMPQPGLGAVAEPHRSELVARARKISLQTGTWMRQAIADGSARNCDPEITALVSAGGFGWLPKWPPIVESANHRHIADEVTDLFFHGLKAQRRATTRE
ncbi:MAG: TetR/AcrR family transcriptional regulator [Alphaproteobacteria bacterium]|nr:TetR/AcrR family transcriptional regulator [Alphaproteobacteria bacterium]